jgi:hypothetical protein
LLAHGTQVSVKGLKFDETGPTAGARVKMSFDVSDGWGLERVDGKQTEPPFPAPTGLG